MKCKHCNGTGYNDTQRGAVMTEFPPCPWCGGSGYIKDKEQTNEEWFTSLSAEEKAKFMCNIYEMGKNGKGYFMRLDKAVEWLKQPHHEKE